MNIVVAGGTGFVGRHICKALLGSGHTVTVLSRSPHRAGSIPELSGAHSRVGDVTVRASLRGRLDGADAVVGAVQFPNHPVEVPRRGLTYDRYDRQGTEHLIAEARESEVERYVYISGAGASSSSDKPWYRAKGRAEEAIKQSGIAYSMLRPSWAYGPEDRALNRLAAIARFSPVVPRLGVRPQLIQPVYVGDIALAVRRIFEEDEAWGRTFEIGGPEVLTMDEVLRTLLGVLGKRRAVVPVPAPLAKIATAPLTLLPSPPMTPTGIDFATQDGLVDTTELQKILDLHPLSLREGLSRYLPSRRLSA